MTTDNQCTIDPEKHALLVLDCQEGVIASQPGSEAILPFVAEAIAYTRASGGQVAYVTVGFENADYPAIPDRNRTFSAVAQHRMFHVEDKATRIHSTLTPEPGDLVVRKTRFGAMSTTDLHQGLQAKGITDVTLAGLSTAGVVLSTALEAADLDYGVAVLREGTSDPDPETHRVLLDKVLGTRAMTVTMSAFRSLLQA